MMLHTFGPAATIEDKPRILKQHEVIRDYMLTVNWQTLSEIESATGYPQASISAQLRHLRKITFGSWMVDKRRRSSGTWEYRIMPPAEDGQLELF